MTAPESPPHLARPEALAPAGLLAMRVDFAHAVGTRLLVYGWVAGLSDRVASAVLLVGESEFDLLTEAVRVRRPDVTHNFRDQGLGGDEHGFLALLELPEQSASLPALRLQVYLNSGRSGESNWPILRDATIAGATLRAHEGALRPLIPRLSARQRRVLAGFASTPRLSLRADDLSEAAETALALPLHIQLCCVLPGSILVLGGVLPRPLAETAALQLHWDALRLDLLDGLIRVNDLGAGALETSADAELAYLPSGFLFAARLPDTAGTAGAGEARVQARCAQGVATARPQPRRVPEEALAQLIAYLGSIDANARLALCERIAALLREAAPDATAPAPASGALEAALQAALERQIATAVRELPSHLDLRGPAEVVQMVFDRSIRVGDAGVFLIGWFHAAGRAHKVVFHGGGDEFDMGPAWSRWSRPDVDAHLAELGLGASEDPGFFCFVARPAGGGPDYVAVTLESGRTLRVQVPRAPAAEPVLQSVRALLQTVDPARRDFLRLLDRHVGPAVGALWAARLPARHRAYIEFFGPRVDTPLVTIVVPLYGRHDFADVQLALFADDPDFRHVDLVYVVDDPAIEQAFRQACPDLYGLHRVAFTLACPGDNLGFAGATNYGAAMARAPYLLLLNSDVMPRTPGWLGRLLATYRAHPGTGLLGAKLLYEDGSVQHAGMKSVRYAPWQKLWINEHPHKGMHPGRLSGTQEVEAVTAACALVETALYRELGGLSENYVIGDFEDSDLCHRARAAGRVNRVDLDVSLYHLERQSQALPGDGAWRTGVTLYNCWLHDRRWGAAIAAGAKDAKS